MPNKKRSGRRSKPKSKLNNFTNAEIKALEVGSRLDHRGKDGKARAGVVVEKKLNGKLLIKYDNVDTDQEVDEVYPDQAMVDPFSELWAFASVGSLSASPPTAEYIKGFNPGDIIDVNIPISAGWRMANIMKWSFNATGEKLGQVMVEYEEYNSLKYFWLHIDNPEEVALPGQYSGGRKTPKIDSSNGRARNNRSKKRPTVLMVKNGGGKKGSRKKAAEVQPGLPTEDQPGAQNTSKHPLPGQRRSSEGESVSDKAGSKPSMPMVRKSSAKIVIKRKPLKRRSHAELKQYRAAEIERINNEIQTGESSAVHKEQLNMKLNSLSRQQEESSCCETPSSGSDIDSKELFRKKGKQQQYNSRPKQTSYLSPDNRSPRKPSTVLSPDAQVFIPRKRPSVPVKPISPSGPDKPECPSVPEQQAEGQPRFPPQIGEKKASFGRFSRPASEKPGPKVEKPAQAPTNSSRFNRPFGTPPPVVKAQPQRLPSQSHSLPPDLQKDVQAPEEITTTIENEPGALEMQSIPPQPKINKPCAPYARTEQPQPAVLAPPFSSEQPVRWDNAPGNRLSTARTSPSGDDCCEPNPNPNYIPLMWFDTEMLDRGLHLDADERDSFLRARALREQEERRRREQEVYYRTSGYPSSQPSSYSTRDTHYGWRRNTGYYVSPPTESYYQPQYPTRYREQRHSSYSVYGNTTRRPLPFHEPSHRRSDFERQGYIRNLQPQSREPLRPSPVSITPTSAVHGSISPLRATVRQVEGEPSPNKVLREGEKEDYFPSAERLFDQDRVRPSQGVG